MFAKTTIALSSAVVLSTAFALAAAQPASAQKRGAFDTRAQAAPQAAGHFSSFEKIWFDMATGDRERQ